MRNYVSMEVQLLLPDYAFRVVDRVSAVLQLQNDCEQIFVMLRNGITFHKDVIAYVNNTW